MSIVDRPPHARPNKSHNGTFKTTIADRGEAGPVFSVTIEYSVKHTPALRTLDVEIGSVIAVDSVKLQWRGNGRANFVESAVDFNEKLAKEHCDYLLNCFTDIEDKIAEEIRGSLAG